MPLRLALFAIPGLWLAGCAAAAALESHAADSPRAVSSPVAGDAGPLQAMIAKRRAALRGRTVYMDLFGQTTRGTFEGADETGISVRAMGQTLVLPWGKVKPVRLVRIASRVATTTEEFLAIARYAQAAGLHDEARNALAEAARKNPGDAQQIAAVRKALFPKPARRPKTTVKARTARRSTPKPLPRVTSKVKASAVPTFHCLSLYWSPEEGEAGKRVFIKYRKAGTHEWRMGYPMRYHPIDKPECKGDYRGSLVNLKPGTIYDVVLQLEGSDVRTVLRTATWSERFPLTSTVRVASRRDTFTVSKSGTPNGYVLYDGTGSVIDTSNQADVGIMVRASYVILRGFTIRNVKQHGIRIWRGEYHHIVIENCDISQWGTPNAKGFGINSQAGVFSNDKALRAVVIQRCKIHHPSTDSNSWAEKNRTRHPSGPQCVVFWNSEGNHVIRYSEFWSDKDHYFNDILGAGSNASYRGFPGADSDIYGNYVAHCWDDGIEVEGGGQNVRVWNNYVEENLIPIANAATSIGPLYIWRNVSGRSYSPPDSQYGMHGPFLKMGFAHGAEWMTGHMYIFNNTIFQPNGDGPSGVGGSGRLIRHCVTRNNILHVRDRDSRSISTSKESLDNDFDYDLLSARYPDGHEKHGVRGVPKYVPGAGFSFETKTGVFGLQPGSRGYDQGVVIPNFCDRFQGNAPDMGAHESGTPPMRFGIKATFEP